MSFPPIRVPHNRHHPYNPSYPYVLGVEYVPIQNDDILFLPEPTTEYGYRYRDEGTVWRANDDDGDYNNDSILSGFPSALVGVYDLLKQPQFSRARWYINLYPPGGEYGMGEVKSVIVPTASWTATGNSTLDGNDTYFGADTTAMMSFRYRALVPGDTNSGADFAFDLTGYRDELYGKRILDVSLLYSGSFRDYAPEVTGLGIGMVRQVPVTYDPQFRQYKYEPLGMAALLKTTGSVNLPNSSDIKPLVYTADGAPRGWGALPAVVFQSSDWMAIPPNEQPIGQLSLGNSTRGTSVYGFSQEGEFDYNLLEALHPSFPLAGRLTVRLWVQIPNTASATVGQYPRLVFNFIGLKITYCDESRIAYGPVPLPTAPGNPGQAPQIVGSQFASLYRPRWTFTGSDLALSSLYTPGNFPKGVYTVTLTTGSVGEDGGRRQRFTSFPLLATRPLYANPMLDPVAIEVPYPATSTSTLGKTSQVKTGELMPKVTLLPRLVNSDPEHRFNSHVYSRQAPAQIYGMFNASQRVIVGSTTVAELASTMDQIRFYARREPGTTVPLRVQQDISPGAVFQDRAGVTQIWETLNSIAYAVTGDISIITDFTYYGWDQSTQFDHHYLVDYGVVHLTLNSLRSIVFKWTDGLGADHSSSLSPPLNFVPRYYRGRLRVKVELDVNNGAGGYTVRWYLATAANTRWTLVSTDTNAGTTDILSFANSSNVQVNPDFGGTTSWGALEGKNSLVMHSLLITDVANNRTVADPNFDQQFFLVSDSTEQFNDSVNNQWSGTGAPIYQTSQIPSAEITPEEFDALEPLTVDGWREVTLALDPPLAIPLVIPYLRWTALGERAGSRWEVLAVSSWEPSGNVQSNFIKQWPVGLWNSTDPGTYSGRNDGLQWVPQMGPYATGGTDFRSDVSFLLARTPDNVTGLTTAQLVQELDNSPNDCNITPCGIATGLNYTHLEWAGKSRGAAFRDRFDREESGTWGSPTYGPDYVGYGDQNFFSVDGTGGLIDLSTRGFGLYLNRPAPAVSGSYVWAADAAPFDITGDIDIRADALLFDWSSGSEQVLISKWLAAGDQRSYQLGVTSTGQLELSISTDGTAAGTLAFTSAQTVGSILDGNRVVIRATLDVDDGSGDAVCTYYTGPTIDGPWTQFSEPVNAGSTVSIFAGTAHLEAGSRRFGSEAQAAGIIYALQILDGIDGTIVAYPQFNLQPNGTATFFDSFNAFWVVAGTYTTIRYQDNPGVPTFTGQLVPLPASTNGLTYGVIFDDSASSWVYAPNDPALDIASDIDIRVDWTPTVLGDPSLPSGQVIVAKWGGTTNECSWHFGLTDDAHVRFTWSPTGVEGVTNSVSSTAVFPGTSGERICIRVQRVGTTFTFYTGESTGDLDTVSWSELGSSVVGSADAIFVGTADVTIGARPFSGVSSAHVAKNTVVHAVQVRDSAGVTVAYPRFDQQTFGTTTFTDEVGLVWATNGLAKLVPGAGSDFDFTVKITQLNDLYSFETPAYARLYGRWYDDENFYYVDLVTAPEVTGGLFSVDDAGFQGLYLQFGRYAGGIQQVIDERQLVANPYGFGAGVGAYVRWLFHDTLVKIKVWPENYDEPLMWTLETEAPLYTALALSGDSSSSASTPDNAALDITGDIDLRVDFSMNLMPPVDTSNATLISKWSGSQRSYALEVVVSTGVLRLVWSTDGSSGGSLSASSTVPVPFLPGQRVAVRATLDVDNGAGNRVVKFYYAYPQDGETMSDVTWLQLGSTVTTAGTTSIFAGTADLRIGAVHNSLGTWAGFFYSAEVYNGIDGTLVANPNFYTGYAAGGDFGSLVPIPGETTIFDTVGRTWTINGDAFIPYNLSEYGYQIGFFAKHAEGFASYKFSDLYIGPPRYWFGYYELQRSDAEDVDDWKTIMKATDPIITEFNDYEARPGIETWYRIREVDKYGFVGAWSDSVSGMIPAPGATGGECFTDGHMLLFTTNEVQDGSSNLAYASVWEDGTVAEDFNFPDAAVVEMQTMYNRDFYTAFRPMERAGEQFDRNVLVQAAAVSPTILANFTSLRDLSWDDLNYVCVRDEDGNRWLATITIPTGSVKRRRTIYIAPIHIAEVTETPTPVDPEWLP